MPPIDSGHLCESAASFIVLQDGDRIGIPIIDEGVTVHVWKDGPASFNRRAEVTFPITDGDEPWYTYINGYNEDKSNAMQPAEVWLSPLNADGSLRKNPDGSIEEHLGIRGYISSIGTQSGANKGHVTIMGPDAQALTAP